MDKKAKNKKKTGSTANIVMAVQAAIIVLLIITIGVLAGQEPRVVTNFEACDALFESTTSNSSRRTESGRVCVINGERFYEEESVSEDYNFKKDNKNKINKLNSEEKAYIGLTEEEAIQKAESSNVPVRILARDGQFYPMTMDLVDGRVNLTIDDNKVTAVQIESAQTVEEE